MRRTFVNLRLCLRLGGLLAAGLGLVAVLSPMAAEAQSSSSSSQSSSSSSQSSSSAGANGQAAAQENNPALRPRAAQIEAGGSAVTLETNEPLFQLATALNVCGYDADLANSAPVRGQVRAVINAILATNEEARASRDKLCAYVTLHRLNDGGLDVGQYVSLALYLSPPPELTPNVSELDLPPQAAAVVNVLDPLRDFAEKVDLHYLWIKHRPQYEALVARVHDPMVQMILATNIYLHQPVSSYDGRRFLVLLEPMLSPALTNARIYGNDYIIVTSPDDTPAAAVDTPEAKVAADPVRMDQIRHIYLHYVVEPMVYSRGQAMERIQPMLRGVQDAPLEFSYKSDVVALMTECLIKAIEARTYTMASPKPKKPGSHAVRADEEQYSALLGIYEKQTALKQRDLVTADESHGWVLTGYFYDQLGKMEHAGDGLRDEIAPMIYGMDVEGQRQHAERILFAKAGDDDTDPLRPMRQARKLGGMDLAELDLMQGKPEAAGGLADKEMADPVGDHGRATYVLARIELMGGHPDDAQAGFEKALTLTKDPRTLAWSHIYLGRLYDIEYDDAHQLMRPQALAEYKAALAARDSRPDTKEAAEEGMAKPFTLPQRTGAAMTPATTDADDTPFDPTGKAEKDAYKPGPK